MIYAYCFSAWFVASLAALFLADSAAMVLITVFAFAQNVAFTFVSRGRNSGSLGYHVVASIFSNGIYAAMLFAAVDVVSSAAADPLLFILCYAMSTVAGSVFAHKLALQLERGKARNVQEDRVGELEETVAYLIQDYKDLDMRVKYRETPTVHLGEDGFASLKMERVIVEGEERDVPVDTKWRRFVYEELKLLNRRLLKTSEKVLEMMPPLGPVKKEEDECDD